MIKLKGKRLSSIPFSIYLKIKSFYLKQNLKSAFNEKTHLRIQFSKIYLYYSLRRYK
jgi:hypothetical protein